MKRDIEFLYEIGALRNVDRTWRQFMSPGVANVTEHTFRVMWIALLLARMENADSNKVLMLALVHDVAESRTGDVHYLSRQYTQRDETKAIADIFDQTLLTDMADLAHEAAEKKTIEAQIVKDADNLDCEFELNELKAQGQLLGSIWRESRKASVYPRLFTKSAKKLYEKIHTTNPHAWHINTNNRFKSGDWKNTKT